MQSLKEKRTSLKTDEEQLEEIYNKIEDISKGLFKINKTSLTKHIKSVEDINEFNKTFSKTQEDINNIRTNDNSCMERLLNKNGNTGIVLKLIEQKQKIEKRIHTINKNIANIYMGFEE